MSRKIDIKGKRFGRLTAVKEDGRDSHGIILWLCECECGETCHVRSADLRHGLVKSCGCLNTERLPRWTGAGSRTSGCSASIRMSRRDGSTLW